MKRKCKCPVCGKMKYLHCRILADNKAFVPFVLWICDDCDKPVTVKVVDSE